MSDSLHSDQAGHNVGPDLGFNCLANKKPFFFRKTLFRTPPECQTGWILTRSHTMVDTIVAKTLNMVKNLCRNTIRVSNRLEPYQVPHNVGPILDPKMLQKKTWLLKNFFRNIIIVSSSLDADQARHKVRPDLGLNCLQKEKKQKKTTTTLVLKTSINTFRLSNNCILIRSHTMLGLIWVQAICKNYQQTTP